MTEPGPAENNSKVYLVFSIHANYNWIFSFI